MEYKIFSNHVIYSNFYKTSGNILNILNLYWFLNVLKNFKKLKC